MKAEASAEPGGALGSPSHLLRRAYRFTPLTPSEPDARLIRHMHLEHLHGLWESSERSKKPVRYSERIEENRRAGPLQTLKNTHRFSDLEPRRLSGEVRDADLLSRSSDRPQGYEENEEKTHLSERSPQKCCLSPPPRLKLRLLRWKDLKPRGETMPIESRNKAPRL